MTTYTYRNGKRLPLVALSSGFIVRALPESLSAAGVANAIQVSSASSRVLTTGGTLEATKALASKVGRVLPDYINEDTLEPVMITDRIIVKFRSGIKAEDIDACAAKYGLYVLKHYTDQDALMQLTTHCLLTPVQIVVQLTENESSVVEAADHVLNHEIRPSAIDGTREPGYSLQWYLHRRSIDRSFDPRSSAECEAAWELLNSTGSAEVVIGMSDNGCMLMHSDFASVGKFAGWAYFLGDQLVRHIDVGADPQKMYVERYNHGTYCALVAAANLDGHLAVGAAPGCRLLPIKWEMSPEGAYLVSDDKMLTLLEFIGDKVGIFSNSWGGPFSNLWPSLVTERIAQLAVSGGRRGRGIVFVWAAGNENRPISYEGNVEVPYTSGWENVKGVRTWIGPKKSRSFINDLVGVAGVLHIAALSSRATRSHYSNYGAGVSLCAPSSNFHMYRRSKVEGLSTMLFFSNNNPLAGFGGTSHAAPLVAGIAALIISAKSKLRASDVIEVMKKTASKDLDFSGYPRTQPADFDRDTAWDVSPIPPFDDGSFKEIGVAEGTWSPWFGHGKVDAAASVRMALARAEV